MTVNEIRELAKKKGVKAGKMKKSELVRAIQQAEGNPCCFDTGHAAECGEEKCLWREDCS
ncbi:MAG: hypothetical protein FD174_2672 [Geobacteraceae bacterium]|nr:MAG: hypothetical protein FD174_2672 [Geobacteraceae bacterium]